MKFESGDAFCHFVQSAVAVYKANPTVDVSQSTAAAASGVTALHEQMYEQDDRLEDIHYSLLDLIDDYDEERIAQTWSSIDALAVQAVSRR